MTDIIDADKIQKIVYYAEQAKKSYQESVRQKKISQDFLHKACQLILNDEVNKIYITYSKDKDGKITLEE